VSDIFNVVVQIVSDSSTLQAGFVLIAFLVSSGGTFLESVYYSGTNFF